MKRSILLLFVVWAGVLQAQVGTNFPDIDLERLSDDQKVKFPQVSKGKITLVGVAYSKKSDELLKPWFEPVYKTFVQPDKGLFSVEYDVNIYFIGMIKGVAQVAGEKIEKEMRQGIDKKLQPYVYLYKGSISTYKDVLKLGQKDLPYFFVLDEKGKIIYATSGAYSEEKLEEVIDKMPE
jgi:hypothetical protein